MMDFKNAKELLEKNNIHLPDFGYWTLEEWKALHFFPGEVIRLCAAPGLYSTYSAQTRSYILCIVKTSSSRVLP